MSDGPEEARRKKLEEMQKNAQLEEQLRAALRSILDDPAYDRMMNVKVSNPELYLGAAQGCVSVSHRLGRKLGDNEVLLILRRLKGGDKETRIKFERK